MEMKALMEDIEKLRENLETLIKKKEWDLLEPEVLDASKRLNVAITDYNNLLKDKMNKF